MSDVDLAPGPPRHPARDPAPAGAPAGLRLRHVRGRSPSSSRASWARRGFLIYMTLFVVVLDRLERARGPTTRRAVRRVPVHLPDPDPQPPGVVRRPADPARAEPPGGARPGDRRAGPAGGRAGARRHGVPGPRGGLAADGRRRGRHPRLPALGAAQPAQRARRAAEAGHRSAQQHQTSQRHQPADERADEEVLGQPVHPVLLVRRGQLGPAQQALGRDHDRGGGEVAGQPEPEDEDPLERTEQPAALERRSGPRDAPGGRS